MRESPIRVLHLGHAPRAAGARQAAAFDYCSRLAATTRQDDIEHALAIVRRRGQVAHWGDAALRLGIDWHDVVRYGRCDMTVLWRLARLARGTGANVVHAHDAASRWAALLLQPVVGFRIVATAAGWAEGTWRQRISAGVDRKLLPGFDRVIAANNQLARHLCRLGCRPQQIDVIYGGVDTDLFSRQRVRGGVRDQLRLTAADRVIGVNASCTDAAEVQAVIEAVRFAQSDIGPLHVLIFAPDASAQEASAHVGGQLPPARVHVLSDREDLPEIYAALDLLVLSRSATAAALLEAQSMEVPVVANGAGDIGELIEHGTTGVVVDDSPLHVGAAIASVLCDRQGAASLAAAGRLRICQRFRFDDLLTKITSAYRRACAQA